MLPDDRQRNVRVPHEEAEGHNLLLLAAEGPLPHGGQGVLGVLLRVKRARAAPVGAHHPDGLGLAVVHLRVDLLLRVAVPQEVELFSAHAVLGEAEREFVAVTEPSHLLHAEPVPGARHEVLVFVLLAHYGHQVLRLLLQHLPTDLFGLRPLERDLVDCPGGLLIGEAINEPVFAVPASIRPHDPHGRARPGGWRIEGILLVVIHDQLEVLPACVAEDDATNVDAVLDLVHQRRLRPPVPAADDADGLLRIPLDEVPDGLAVSVRAHVAVVADLVVRELFADERAAVLGLLGVRRDGAAAPPAHGPQALRTGHRDEVKLLGPDGALARRPDLRPGVEVAARVRAPEAEG
mmetsp:Transcript_74518/g.210503  ORF Transcript_74518/g.210503 Transcript_74518/m.210503 type:complete len:349 (-) Transcript_74518:442-1488(-)